MHLLNKGLSDGCGPLVLDLAKHGEPRASIDDRGDSALICSRNKIVFPMRWQCAAFDPRMTRTN